MKIVDRVFDKLTEILGDETGRKAHEFIYLDRDALYEHYKALTGMSEVPTSVSKSSGKSGSMSLFSIGVGVSGSSSTSFEVSERHLFESLEPELRQRYQVVSGEPDVVSNLRAFAWFEGEVRWLHVGPTRLKDEITDQARTFLILHAVGLPFVLTCRPESFSPFYPFLVDEPHLHAYDHLDVEILAYNTGVLKQYGARVAPRSGRSLVLVPTVILLKDSRGNDEIEKWLREFNDGPLSKPYLERYAPEPPDENA
ncbi:MAG: hypothetical protein ACYS99_12145 [Planctomycetota bacterium]|jgi:hypothetical protein